MHLKCGLISISIVNKLVLKALTVLFSHREAVKPTIHEATFVAGDTVTLFVCAAHEISNATFYKLLEN